MNRIARILLISESMKSPKDEFFSKHHIDEDEMYWLGKGDFGDAYEIGDGKVLKITRSQKELDVAKQIMNSEKSLSGFVKIYDAQRIGNENLIIMEQLETPSKIEDMFNELNALLEEQGIPINYIDQYFDTDELELDSEMERFIEDMENIARSYRMLGIEAADIRSENLGYGRSGKPKAFDIFDKQ